MKTRIPEEIKKPRWQAWTLLLSSGLSGAALWAAQTWAEDHVGLWLKLHGASAALALVLFGMILATHVQAMIRKPDKKTSGLGLLVLLGLLCLNGWALYYAGDEHLRARMVWAHKALALALLPAFAAHIWAQAKER